MSETEIPCGGGVGRAGRPLTVRVTQGDGVAPELVLGVPLLRTEYGAGGFVPRSTWGREEVALDCRSVEQLRDRLNVFLADRI